MNKKIDAFQAWITISLNNIKKETKKIDELVKKIKQENKKII